MNAFADIHSLDVAQAMLRSIFPDGVAIGVTSPDEDVHDLLAAEEASLPKATAARQREFAAGRRAAHQAMAALGQAVRPVVAEADRAPVWPDGLTGSISHDDSVCVAAVASSCGFAALGLDIEPDAELPRELEPEICTVGELAWLSVQPSSLRGRLGRLIFSAKEAAYKCQYTRSRTVLGFDAMEITPDPQTGQFEATFTRDVPGFPARRQLAGRFVLGGGVLMCGVTLSAEQARSADPGGG
ncbi:MAG: 4'-phosphopantetheinyl transferase superfamily protein [Roseovarius sp.]|nr:4'-phosphopantetheinyl transferase superfamily protein [Roseovarius sp.]